MSEIAPLPGRELKPEQWEWNKGEDPPFHLRQTNPTLIQFYHRLFDEQETGRVFIPLCGKTLDMVYFADKGHSVVGVEFSEVGIEAFFCENELTYNKKVVEGTPFTMFVAKEKDITIYNGDFFAMKKDICGQFDAFWDRGGFVAINENERNSYLDIVIPMMKSASRYLLEVYNYDGSKFAGPPHYVTPQHINDTFGRKCTVEEIASVSMQARPCFTGLDVTTKTQYLIKLKNPDSKNSI